MDKSRLSAYFAVSFAMVCWALSFVWIKVAYEAYEPFTVVIFRLIFASILMGIFLLFSRKKKLMERSDLKQFMLLAFFEPFLYFIGESYGLKYVSSTVGAVIVATIPLFSPIAAWYFHKERLTRNSILGILLSVFGVGVVVMDDFGTLAGSPLGIALEFLAVFAAIGYAVILKDLAQKYSSTIIVTYQNFIGIFYFLPIWFFFESETFFATPFHFDAFSAILKLSIFASVFAFMLFTVGVRNLGVNNANMFINIIPVFTAIFAYFILGDSLSVQKFAGIAIVLSGVFLSQLKKRVKV